MNRPRQLNEQTSAIIGLGANLPSDFGTPENTLRYALMQLEDEGIRVQSVSRFYATPCFPVGAGPDYVNAAAVLASRLTAQELIAKLHSIESQAGRERLTRWGQRVLDLDLLAYGDEIAPDMEGFLRWQKLPLEQQSRLAPEQLILPHPRLQDRAFVLVPMADIAPNWRHPVLGRTVRQLLDELDAKETAQIKPIQ